MALGHLWPGAVSIGFLLGLEMTLFCCLIPRGVGPRAWDTELGCWGNFFHSCKGEGRHLLLCRKAQSATFGQNEHPAAESKAYIKKALPAAGLCKEAVAFPR